MPSDRLDCKVTPMSAGSHQSGCHISCQPRAAAPSCRPPQWASLVSTPSLSPSSSLIPFKSRHFPLPLQDMTFPALLSLSTLSLPPVRLVLPRLCLALFFLIFDFLHSTLYIAPSTTLCMRALSLTHSLTLPPSLPPSLSHIFSFSLFLSVSYPSSKPPSSISGS